MVSGERSQFYARITGQASWEKPEGAYDREHSQGTPEGKPDDRFKVEK